MANEKRLIYSDSLFEEASKAEFMGFRANERKQNFLDMISAMLDNCPTVDAVEVVHGRWLDGYAVDHNGKEVYKSIDCSVCNDIFKVETEDREYWKNRFKECPFCGAKMDGGNEDA